MQVKLIVFPEDNGLNVVIWGKWSKGPMRIRHFDNRTEMVHTLQTLGLINSEDSSVLESFTFRDSCPLFSAEIEETALAANGFVVTEAK